MDDCLEDVGVCASRHSLEETSTHDLAAVCDTGCPEHCARAFDDVRQIKEDPSEFGVAGQDGRQQCPVSTTNIDDPLDFVRRMKLESRCIQGPNGYSN